MHPTDLDERESIRRKHARAATCRHRYTFAFSRTNYCDIEFFNLTGKPTTTAKEFREGMASLNTPGAKPVVFFLGYDVGYKEGPRRFVRHVVCCIANRTPTKVEILGFDMRNLREISNTLRLTLEQGFQTFVQVPVTYTNIACVERTSCVYLQRYKKHTDIGWCIAWALFFLDAALCSPLQGSTYASDLSVAKQKHAFAEIYRLVDGELSRRKSNGFIEEWFAAELEG